ncbi:hypothetical protein DUNSADRAFT_1769 [Dunaliella salina]|uniref:Encoded protein n=1 Tax=Dunaliella salina TaxID=3046 RepID=A0ABQ7FX30_DUNSA|nr:hypothetical protein DUNSADRAFT_1769 [Dunaliella salina]|eukprot:KAF5826909.1 hypothetical protein DUNSADRAFT_1769 [Dunaliella salina]
MHRISSLQQLYRHCFSTSCCPSSVPIACWAALQVGSASWPSQEGASGSSISSSCCNSNSNLGVSHKALPLHDGFGAVCGTPGSIEGRSGRSGDYRETTGKGCTHGMTHSAHDRCIGLLTCSTRQHPASPSSAFWWLQGGGSSQQQLPATSMQAGRSHCSLPPPNPFFRGSLAPLSVLRCSQLESLPLQHQQLRSYKSNKKSMKPVYAKASRLAVQPLLPPITKEEREQRLRYTLTHFDVLSVNVIWRV